MVGSICLLALVATFGVTLAQTVDEAPATQSAADLLPSRLIMQALFGDEFCASGSCGGYEVVESSSQYPTSKEPEDQGHEIQKAKKEFEELIVKEQQDFEPVLPSEEEVVEPLEKTLFSILCARLLTATKIIEAYHPDVADIKFKVLGDFIRYISSFAEMQAESCKPAVHLVDIIVAAAEKLREDYKSDSNYWCELSEATKVSKEEDKYETTVGYGSSEVPSEEPETITGQEPCPEASTAVYKRSTEPPCAEEQEVEEIIAEEDEEYERRVSPPFVGSLRGVPGEHYPNYTEIPITSFSCADKCVPGFYADLETGCQVFHVCYEHRRESFLCPLGTIFNQPILACDFWYSANCSLAPSYYDVNCKSEEIVETEEVDASVGEFITSIVEGKPEKEEYPELSEDSMEELAQFLPVKAKVTVFPKADEPAEPVSQDVEEIADDIFEKILTTATHTVSKTREVVAKLPEPAETELEVELKPVPVIQPKIVKKVVVPSPKLVAVKAVPVAKFVAAKAALPLAKATKLAIGKKLAVKAAIPVVAGKAVAGKVLAAKAAVPVIAKAKVVAAAVPVVTAKLAAGKLAAAKVAVPVVTAKLAAGKLAAAKVAVPVVSGKLVVAKAIPVAVKTKLAIASKVAVPAKVAAAVAAKAAIGKTVIPSKVIAKGVIAAKLPLAKIAIKGPVLKTKILAAAIPFGKSAVLKASVPVVKAKLVPVLKAKALKAASVPIVKGKMMALPLAKGKLVAAAPLLKAKVIKAAVISPLTKKALAIGYMKLLKAKKLALMG